MARNARGGRPGRTYVYVPTALGNAAASPEDRVSVTLRELPHGDALDMLEPRTRVGSTRRIIEMGVVSVAGYEGPEGPIVTAADLVRFGEWEIQLDVADEIYRRTTLGEVEKKLSAEPFVSSSVTIRPLGGTAPDAGPTGGAVPGAAT